MIEVVTIRSDIAVEYGTNVAILLGNFHYWIEHNRVNGANFHDGRYWTYNSVAAFHELFPFLSERAITTALGKAEAEGLIVTGNYNKLPFDRTKWYAFTDKGEELFAVKTCESCTSDYPSGATSICPNREMDTPANVKCHTPEMLDDIPPKSGTNTKGEPVKNSEDNPKDIVRQRAASQGSPRATADEKLKVSQVVDHLNEVTGGRYRPSSKATSSPILARLREGFTPNDLNQVVDKKAREWLGTEMAPYLRPQTLFGQKCESYLNAPERAADKAQAAISRNASRYQGIIDEDEPW